MKRRLDWNELIERYENSDLSQRAFCKEEGVSLASFSQHKARLSVRKRTTEFVELPTPASRAERIELTLPNGVSLSLPLNTSTNRLAEVVACLS